MKYLMLLLLMSNLYAGKDYSSEDYVICSFPKTQLIKFIQTGDYRPESLELEGFVHCCRPSQLKYVMDKFFHEDEQILLISHKNKMGEELVYENNFPHLYRAFSVSDLLDVLFIKREEGQFSVPEVFYGNN